MNLKEIAGLFEKLKEATTDPETVAKLCEKYMSDTTPTSDLSIMDATIDPYSLIPSLRDRESGLQIIKHLAGGLTALLHERGYRNNIETHQEHLLYGSSGSGLNSNAKESPYTVGAILNKEITVEEARKARELEKFHGASGTYWGIEDEMERGVIMLLPPIDDFGKTIRDPVLVDKNGNIVAEKLVEGAPYKR